MKYLNQLEHRHIRYEHNVENGGVPEERRNVATSGCGLCCACMMVDILTDKELTIEECVELSVGCAANYKVGTSMRRLGPVVAEKFGLDYAETNELSVVIEHLRNGGQAIALVGVPEGCEIGLFTKSGHYINLISTDGKEFCILDPSYTPTKYTIPERDGKVNFDNAPYLYCDVNIVQSELKPERVGYYLFSRKK